MGFSIPVGMSRNELALSEQFRETGADEGLIDKTALLLFCNRSGSNYLAALLVSTGVFSGFREIFNAEALECVADIASVGTFSAYVRHQRATDAPGERFWGAKASSVQLFYLFSRGVIPHVIHPLLIDIRREDKLGQAISLHIARHSGAWANEPPGSVPYDRNKILSALQYINRVEADLDLAYLLFKLMPHRVVYEELIEFPEEVVASLCTHLGVGRVFPDPSKVAFRKQRNDLSETFRERFLTDLDQIGIEWKVPDLRANKPQEPPQGAG